MSHATCALLLSPPTDFGKTFKIPLFYFMSVVGFVIVGTTITDRVTDTSTQLVRSGYLMLIRWHGGWAIMRGLGYVGRQSLSH